MTLIAIRIAIALVTILGTLALFMVEAFFDHEQRSGERWGL